MWEKPLRATARGFIHTPVVASNFGGSNGSGGSYHAKSLRPGLHRARSPGRRRSCRNGCDRSCRGELRGLRWSLRKRLSPSLRLAPLVIRGVLRREVEPPPIPLLGVTILSSRIRCPRKLRSNRRAPYVFGPGLIGDVQKLPSHAACAATRHARPAPSVVVQRTSAWMHGSRPYMTKLEAPRLFLGVI